MSGRSENFPAVLTSWERKKSGCNRCPGSFPHEVANSIERQYGAVNRFLEIRESKICAFDTFVTSVVAFNENGNRRIELNPRIASNIGCIRCDLSIESPVEFKHPLYEIDIRVVHCCVPQRCDLLRDEPDGLRFGLRLAVHSCDQSVTPMSCCTNRENDGEERIRRKKAEKHLVENTASSCRIGIYQRRRVYPLMSEPRPASFDSATLGTFSGME